MLNYAFFNPSFFGVLKKGECVNDSAGVSIAFFLKTGSILERFQGIELFYNALCFASAEGFPVFIYGAEESANRKASENVMKKFPGINICGRLNGYTEGAVEIIKRTSPKILFVALDSPRQEIWINENLSKLRCAAMGIGGTLDVVSGNLARAPGIFRRIGFEWFGRLIREPRRLHRMANLPVFLARVILGIFGAGKAARSSDE